MTKEWTIACGGCLPPGKRGTARVIELRLHGRDSNVRLEINDICRKRVAAIPSNFVDLIEIASYVYSADQSVSRGGDTGRALGNGWRRNLHFHIPVRNVGFWSSREVTDALSDVLSFLSDEDIRFSFYKLARPPAIQEYLKLEQASGLGAVADEVVLFSGGLDSLAGAVLEAAASRRKVVLVSHRSTPKLDNPQQSLVRALNDKLARGAAYHIPVWVNKVGLPSKEETQRTRTFLYASLAATTAAMYKLQRLRFYENGVTSLNLPISEQLLGSRASRSTNPRVLAGFGTIFGLLTNDNFSVENPVLWNTKSELVDRIGDAGYSHLIQMTRSCHHTMTASKKHPHCGQCSQCIGRRFALLASRYAECDDFTGYNTDLLLGPRNSDEENALVQSYVRFARGTQQMNDATFFAKYGELTRVLNCLEGGSSASWERIKDLYRRHSLEVERVLRTAIEDHSTIILQGDLPASSLLAHAVAINSIPPRTPEAKWPYPGLPGVTATDDCRTVTVNARFFSFTPTQARCVEYMLEQSRDGPRDITQARILEEADSRSENLQMLFKQSEAWGRLIVAGARKGTYRISLEIVD